ncbi:chlorohydrolase [Streptococcus pneumoniae]|uniref:chlorohydrolase n=1 Tax=Streptococcus pneumoniae TaxID=1313 RepID=UPI000B5902A5|nr:chlorohydrolase [Streptococcus pneumoniae]
MKIKDQTRKLAAGCSKHCRYAQNTVDTAQNTVLRLWMKLAWFEEIFKEYYSYCQAPKLPT